MVKKDKNTETDAEAKVSKKEQKTIDKAADKSVDKVVIKPIEKQTVTRVGAMLKNMRQEKGLKVADIAKFLCVRKQYIEAIEESNYQEIPAFPYGIGFIRSYADYLGLNSGNIVELYKEETNVKKTEEINVNEPQTTAAMPNIVYILISLVAIALVYGGWMLLNRDDEIETANLTENLDYDDNVIVIEEASDDETEQTATSLTIDENNPNEAKEATVSENEEGTVPSQESNSETKTKELSSSSIAAPETTVAKPTIPTKGVYLEIVDESWVEVKNELKLYLSKVLKPGESYTLPNDKGLILSVGKSGGVNVYVNGVKTDLTQNGKKMNIDIDSYLQSRR